MSHSALREWINEKLSSITIKDGRCEQLRYLRSKGGKCSQKFFDCVNELICARLLGGGRN